MLTMGDLEVLVSTLVLLVRILHKDLVVISIQGVVRKKCMGLSDSKMLQRMRRLAVEPKSLETLPHYEIVAVVLEDSCKAVVQQIHGSPNLHLLKTVFVACSRLEMCSLIEYVTPQFQVLEKMMLYCHVYALLPSP